MNDAKSRSGFIDTVPGNVDIFNMAWPLGLKAVMLHGIVVIDTLLVAGLGESGLAAMGLAASVAGILLGILFSFSNATQIRIAQAFGSRSPHSLKTGLVCGLVVNGVSSLVGLIAMLAMADTILRNFAHTPDIAFEARQYLEIFVLVILAEAYSQSISSYFNGCGETRVPFFSYLLSLPVNVIVSAALIYGYAGFPELGVAGAAAGSAVAAAVRAAYLTLVIARGHMEEMRQPGWRNGTFSASLWRHFTFSLPIAVTFISMTAANSACTLLFARMSVNHFAAMTLIQPWIQVAGTIGIAWAQATGIIMAQLLGRSADEPELDTFLIRSWRGAIIAAALVSLVYLGVGLSSGWIYSNLENETRAALLGFLPVLLMLPFPKGSNAICGHTLRASGDTVYVMNVFVGSQWLFRVPATALFILVWDLSVLWVFALFLLDELVKLYPFHSRLIRGDWKQRAGMFL